MCGIVEGLLNLILPLWPKSFDTSWCPIVILSNDYIGDDNLKGDTLIWKEINKFEEIYIIKGSALNPGDLLERTSINKAKAIIILSRNVENTDRSSGGGSMLDADAIFMYKAIKYVCPTIRIITELS